MLTTMLRYPPHSLILLFQYEALTITMHAKDIAINEKTVTVKRANGETIQIKGFEYGFERDFFIIHLMQPMNFNEEMTIEMQ